MFRRLARSWIAFAMLMAPAAGWAFKDWHGGVDEALALAKGQNKPALIYFYHPVSLARDKEVWMHPLVQRYSGEFVAIHVNINDGGEYASRFGVKEFPAVSFIDPEGNEIVSLRIEADGLKRTYLALRMKRVLEAVQEFQMVQNQLKRTPDNAKLVLMHANGLRDRAMFSQAEDQYNRLFDWSGLDAATKREAEQGYVGMLFLQASRAFYDGEYGRCIDIMQRFLRQYPGNDGIHQAKFIMGIALWESGDRRKGEGALRELAKDASAGIFREKAEMYLEEKKGGR